MANIQVQCPECEAIGEPDPPERRRLFGLCGVGLFGGIGAIMGSAIGIATAGLGAPAVIPLGLIGVYVGWKVGTWFAAVRDGETCPACGHEISESRIESAAERVSESEAAEQAQEVASETAEVAAEKAEDAKEEAEEKTSRLKDRYLG
jgi:xanthosine utilization system XapX-like protein